MSIFWRLCRSILFWVDAEAIHRFTVQVLRVIFFIPRGKSVLLSVSCSRENGREEIGTLPAVAPVSVAGVSFLNPVGLAAGFDKDAELLPALPYLGFGFAEIGTVTPRPQFGNPKPRLFRDPARNSLFNCMGFNSAGAERVAVRVIEARGQLPAFFKIGLNVGKNKDTPLDQAGEDYADAVKPFRDNIDYLTLNVSSPNTPGLRSLQNVETLRRLVDQVRNQITTWRVSPPIFLKLAPELQGDPLKELLQAGGEALDIQGWVLTNTWGGEHRHLKGGWSGGCLTESSRMSLAGARSFSSLPIISVGGILSEAECLTRFGLGADLIQIYTGWIMKGPSFPSQLYRAWLGWKNMSEKPK